MIISDGLNHSKLQTIVIAELKKSGLKHRLKKIMIKNVKDNKTIFGAPLSKVPSSFIMCCGSKLNIPKAVLEMCYIIKRNAHIEGLFRKAGSQSRQKEIKKLLDAEGCLSDGHHPIDVASVLKLYLRCLPEPLIGFEVQDLLLRCRVTAENDLKSILQVLLLLPVLQVHLLHFIMELLNYIASNKKYNLMDSSNLAIVMAPSIMPLPSSSSTKRLDHHVALIKMLIENSQHIGLVTEDLLAQLNDDDCDIRVTGRKKRRSGSFNRMLSGLRKMVTNSVVTPAPLKESGRTPILCKSASKRKLETHCEGLSAKTKKDITKSLPQKELIFTPIKMDFTERKRLRLSMLDSKCTPSKSDLSLYKSKSSEDLHPGVSEQLFSNHDTIDLSPDMKHEDKDYIRIPKQEYEEIKNRVSAIEKRLSQEFTDAIPKVESAKQVQNVYEQTLEEVATLHCPDSDNLARRLSRELNIRPSVKAKVIRSPSARKIGNIRRRSKENIPKVARNKSWNINDSQVQHIVEGISPYVGLIRRERTTMLGDTTNGNTLTNKVQKQGNVESNNILDILSYNDKYKSNKSGKAESGKATSRVYFRKSLDLVTNSSSQDFATDNSCNSTINSSAKSIDKWRNCRDDNVQQKVKWKNAAAYFMDKNNEVDNVGQTGRPSVNKIWKQNAGGVLAKARLFESSSQSEKSSDDEKAQTVFARRPRASQQNQINKQRQIAHVKPKVHLMKKEDHIEKQVNNPSKQENLIDKTNKFKDPWEPKTTPLKRGFNADNPYTPQTPVIKKKLCTPRTLRTPVSIKEQKKAMTPLKVLPTSPRRRSPRLKNRMSHN